MTVAFHLSWMPEFAPAPIVTMTAPFWMLLLMMRPMTGGTLALSQFGFSGSGFFGSGHGGNFLAHFLTRRLGGLGHSIVPRHAGTLMSGGVGHLSLHGGQPGGAPNCGQISLH